MNEARRDDAPRRSCGRRSGNGDGRFWGGRQALAESLVCDAGLGQHRRQFARLEHLAGDVGAADELALDVELRDRRPVGEFLDSLTDFGVLEDVDADHRRAEIVENLHHLTGEAALGNSGVPFINSTTGFSEISFWMRSCTFAMALAFPDGGQGPVSA